MEVMVLTRAKAMRIMQELLKENFKYLYEPAKTQINELHLCFKMDSQKYELQTSMMFEPNWVDILTFISPTAVKVESAVYMEVLKTVNYINWASKSTTGRMYLDDYGDIAYSLRFTYDWLDKYPEIVIREYESAIQYYEDLFMLLLEVAENKIIFEDARDFIEQMWNLC